MKHTYTTPTTTAKKINIPSHIRATETKRLSKASSSRKFSCPKSIPLLTSRSSHSRLLIDGGSGLAGLLWYASFRPWEVLRCMLLYLRDKTSLHQIRHVRRRSIFFTLAVKSLLFSPSHHRIFAIAIATLPMISKTAHCRL